VEAMLVRFVRIMRRSFAEKGVHIEAQSGRERDLYRSQDASAGVGGGWIGYMQ